MDTIKEFHQQSQRSIFSLNSLEIATAIIAALATWFGLRSYLQSALPFPCGSSAIDILIECTEKHAWQTLGQPLFLRYAIPLTIISTLATVFLVRIFQQDVKDISIVGSIALVWPLPSIIGIHFLAYLGLCILPIGFVFSIIATIMSVEEKRYKWDWLSLPISFVSMVLIGMYAGQLFALYGD